MSFEIIDSRFDNNVHFDNKSYSSLTSISSLVADRRENH